MTKQLKYSGTYKLNLLADEIRAAFPKWWTEIIHYGEIAYETEFYLEGNDKGVKLTVPDIADEIAIQTIIDAHDPDIPTAKEALKAKIISLAQSATGVALNDLTNSQIRALVAVMLWKSGGVASDMTVKSLREWI